MRVAVTGGAGFIGSHTVDLLRAEGVDVLVIDDLTHPWRRHEGDVDVTADCGSTEAGDALRTFRPDAVLHLASKGGVQVAARNPGNHAKASLASTVALYDAAIRSGARRIVSASSGGTIYGNAINMPSREVAAPAPVSVYGAAKLAEEIYLAALGRQSGVSTLSLRYGNVYGPRQDGTGEAGVVAITCERLRHERQPLIFGDGLQTRDFVYVSDVAAANLKALRSRRAGQVNVGTGREASIRELVECLVELAGSGVEIKREAARQGEVRRVCLDATRAHAWLGWKAATRLEQGLASTWSWFASQPIGVAAGSISEVSVSG